MAKMTSQGKVFSVDELINLASINSYGVYNNAVGMALQDLKRLQIENQKLREILKEAQAKVITETDNTAE